MILKYQFKNLSIKLIHFSNSDTLDQLDQAL